MQRGLHIRQPKEEELPRVIWQTQDVPSPLRHSSDALSSSHSSPLGHIYGHIPIPLVPVSPYWRIPSCSNASKNHHPSRPSAVNSPKIRHHHSTFDSSLVRHSPSSLFSMDHQRQLLRPVAHPRLEQRQAQETDCQELQVMKRGEEEEGEEEGEQGDRSDCRPSSPMESSGCSKEASSSSSSSSFSSSSSPLRPSSGHGEPKVHNWKKYKFIVLNASQEGEQQREESTSHANLRDREEQEAQVQRGNQLINTNR